MNYSKQSYSEKLKDPRWQKKRLEILQRDNFTCQFCSDFDSTLHVHHKYYKTGKAPWEYDNDALITYCHVCHKTVELFYKVYTINSIYKVDNGDIITVLAMITIDAGENVLAILTFNKLQENITIVGGITKKTFKVMALMFDKLDS